MLVCLQKKWIGGERNVKGAQFTGTSDFKGPQITSKKLEGKRKKSVIEFKKSTLLLAPYVPSQMAYTWF